MWSWFATALLLLACSCLFADSNTAKRALRDDLPAQLVNLPNGDLETTDANGFLGWRPYGTGYEVDLEVRHSGRSSARCRNQSESDQRGLCYVMELNQTTARPILAECWSKADSVSAGRPGDYSLYLDLEYADGTPLWGQIAPFEPGTHGWQRARVALLPAKPVRRIAAYALLRNRRGTAWFDDLKLWERRAPEGYTLFDLVPVAESANSEVSFMPGPTLSTDDGFALQFDAETGGIFTGALGGFSLRDAAARSDFIRARGPLRLQPDGSLLQQAEDEGLQLRLSATYRVVGNAIRIDGELQDLSGRDRAITVYFTYPVDAIGWQWHDDQRTSRRIEPGEKYGNFATRGAGANGLASRYPFACISGPDQALVIGAPLDLPRLCRFGYDPDSHELYAAVDLGLSPDTKRFPSRATFSLVLYQCDPAWGFRSALQRYYQLFPRCFTKRNQKEGIWMPFTDIATVEGFQDFGFQFKEGDSNVPFDSAHGIYSFVYVEPWSRWAPMPKEMERTLPRAMSLVEERAGEGDLDYQAVASSANGDAKGHWQGRIEDQPWCDGAVFAINPNPSVPTAPGAITQFQQLWSHIEEASARNPDLSGVYHDSFEMYLFPQALNYRREHFAQLETPLVFDTEGRVCQMAMFDMVDFAREIAHRMWQKGKMTFANGTPFDIPWGAAWLDVMGTEFGGQFSDDTANYWRALCYQRPYLLLLNTDYTKLKPEAIELYMKHATAYGFFPSFFSHNASEDPYWEDAKLYNRDRPLFRKYIPIISALSAAGWEPVTHARSSNPQVYVERFGRPGGPLYFTLFNDPGRAGAQPPARRASITFDLSQLKPQAESLEMTEVLSGARLTAAGAGGSAALAIEIAPGDVTVLKVDLSAPGGVAFQANDADLDSQGPRSLPPLSGGAP